MIPGERPREFTVLHLDEVDSTNAEGLRQAAGGARGPTWIVADRQSRGRGRSGRSWTTMDGNLSASLLFEPRCPTEHLHHLALLAGVSLHSAVLDAAQGAISDLRLKWPNDLLIGTAKVGGILVETTIMGAHTTAVIGVGLNIAVAPSIDGRAVASLSEMAPHVTRDVVFAALCRQMDAWIGIWRQGAGFAAIRQAWVARAGRLGETLSINGGAGRLRGTYMGIDDTGALLLRDDSGHELRLNYGDVSLEAEPGFDPERMM
jgi:BirA family transcriptional regulator, biotin operon repressor / biotin---[acetyl-CoA-carboxylase] ligase